MSRVNAALLLGFSSSFAVFFVDKPVAVDAIELMRSPAGLLVARRDPEESDRRRWIAGQFVGRLLSRLLPVRDHGTLTDAAAAAAAWVSAA